MCVALLYLGCLALIYRASEPQQNFKEDFLLWNRSLLPFVWGVLVWLFLLLSKIFLAVVGGVWAVATRKRGPKFWIPAAVAALFLVAWLLPPAWRTASVNGFFAFSSSGLPMLVKGLVLTIFAVFVPILLWVWCYAPTPKKFLPYCRSYEGVEWTLRVRFEHAVCLRYLLIPLLILMVSTDDGVKFSIIAERLMSYAPFVIPFAVSDLWLAAKLRREDTTEDASMSSESAAD